MIHIDPVAGCQSHFLVFKPHQALKGGWTVRAGIPLQDEVLKGK